MKKKRYEEIIEACDDEIKSYEELSTKAGVDGEDEYHSKINGTHDSEDEGISADDSQKECLPNNGSGDYVCTDR